MPNYICCRHKAYFYRFPAVLKLKYKTEKNNNLAFKRRIQWIKAFKREDLSENKFFFSFIYY